MDTQIVTLESPRAVPIPAEAASALGLHAGSRLVLTLKDGGILLQPLLADDLDQLCGIFSPSADRVEHSPVGRSLSSPNRETCDDDIKALRGILASEKGMVEELQEERRQDKW